MPRPHARGFTLIELLVVIAIISVLSSVALAALTAARAKARDTTRLSDMRQLQTALETYKSERGTYPSTGSGWQGHCSGFGGFGTSGASGWIPNLAPTYIRILPVDPKPVGVNFCYLYNSNGADYMLLAYQTVETRISSDFGNGTCNPTRNAADTNPANRPSQPSEADFAFYTLGACSW